MPLLQASHLVRACPAPRLLPSPRVPNLSPPAPASRQRVPISISTRLQGCPRRARASGNDLQALPEEPSDLSWTVSEEAREAERAYLRRGIAASLTMLGQTAGYAAAGAAFQWLSPFPPQTTLALVCTLWAGYVCSISCMEAPVKFLAPMAERWVALDIGRTVFRALNSAELGFAATALVIVARSGLWRPGAYPSRLPIAVSIILVLQTAWLLPALERRAKHAIVGAAAGRAAGLAPAQQAALRALREEVGEAPPPRALHAVYVAVEVAKVLLLATYVGYLLGPGGAAAGPPVFVRVL